MACCAGPLEFPEPGWTLWYPAACCGAPDGSGSGIAQPFRSRNFANQAAGLWAVRASNTAPSQQDAEPHPELLVPAYAGAPLVVPATSFLLLEFSSPVAIARLVLRVRAGAEWEPPLCLAAVRSNASLCGRTAGPALPIVLAPPPSPSPSPSPRPAATGKTSLYPPVVWWCAATDRALVASGSEALVGLTVPIGRPVGAATRFVVYSAGGTAAAVLGVRVYGPCSCAACPHTRQAAGDEA